MAFGAIGFGCQAEGLLAVMADRAIRFLAMIRLGQFHFFFRLEDFCMAGVAFRIRYLHMCIMAEEDRSFLLGFILYISSAHFFLSECRTQSDKACDANADDQNPPKFIAHFLTSFPSNLPLADAFPRK